MKGYTEYELIYIIPSENLDSLDSAYETIKKIIEKNDGKVVKESKPQKRKLAYPIKGARSGVYVINRLLLKKNRIEQLGKDLRLKGDILRSMLVSIEELPQSVPESSSGEKIRETGRQDTKEVRKPTAKEEAAQGIDLELKKKAITQEPEADKKEKLKTPSREKKKESKLKFEDLDKKIDDILKDDLI